MTAAGYYLRRGHLCALPSTAVRGDIWQCDCGRRWTYRLVPYDLLFDRLAWSRRRWPWPRIADNTATTKDTT